MRSRKLSFFLLVVLAGLFTYGLVELLSLRLERGDVYAPYATLRSDPKGAMAFYESLSRLDGLQVTRNFDTFDKLSKQMPATIYILGLDRTALSDLPWDKNLADLVENRGANLVVSITDTRGSTTGPPAGDETTETDEDSKADDEDDRKEKDEPSPEDRQPTWMETLVIDTDFLEERADKEQQAVVHHPEKSWPKSLPWRGALYFEDFSSDWETYYEVDEYPVVVQRRLGNGSVLMIADSYPFSNEALWFEPQPAFLAAVSGTHPRVIFDETHHGVAVPNGIAALARRYRLHGLPVGLILLGLLIIWRNANGLVPRDETYESPKTTLGKDAATGLVNLLTRAIPQQKLIAACVTEWKRSQPHEAAKVKAVERLLARESPKKDPVKPYLTICAALDKRSKHRED